MEFKLKKPLNIPYKVIIPLALIMFPVLIPVALIYLFAALNLGAGYGKMYCGNPQPTFRDKVAQSLEQKGLPVPSWLRKKPKSC
jgi:hypothetical protein